MTPFSQRPTFLVVHHAAAVFASTWDGAQVVDKITEWHKARGFDTIGYHAVVWKGKIYDGRSLEYMGAHVRGWNHKALGICIAGDLTKRPPTDAEVECVLDYWRYLCITRGYISLVGHKDLVATLCPGTTTMDKIRSGARELIRPE